jgi:uncharacterized protein YsxB (DUF464 family)
VLKVVARHDSRGICDISAKGHSGYSDFGSDIVCAAVSALMQALGVGLVNVLGLEDVKFVKKQKSALISCEWDNSTVEVQHIAQTILLSLKGVAESYPEYVSVCERSKDVYKKTLIN